MEDRLQVIECQETRKLEYLKRAEVMLMMKGEMGVQNSGHGLERQEDLTISSLQM